MIESPISFHPNLKFFLSSKWRWHMEPIVLTCGEKLPSQCTWVCTISTAPMHKRSWTQPILNSTQPTVQGQSHCKLIKVKCIFVGRLKCIYFIVFIFLGFRLKQVGPYVWDEYHVKTNISFSEDGDDWRISYYQKKYWIFNETRSNGSLDDWIWTLNMIAVQAAEQTR